MKLSPEMKAEVIRLHTVEHWKVGTIARQLRVHHRQVRRALGLEPVPVPRERGSLLRPYQACLKGWITQYPTLRATRAYDMLKERGFAGSVRTVRTAVAQLRPARQAKAFLEIETLPGEQAQVDWAYVGRVDVAGGQRALWMFVITMAHSRALWAELVYELTAASMARSLTRAAAYFNGVPRTWLFDNTKAVVLDRTATAERLHPLLLETAVALRVQPRLCAPYQPNQKGKTERAIRYLRDRVLCGRQWNTVEHGNAALLKFVTTTAMERLHPTLKPLTVKQVFEQEKSKLLALPPVLPDPESTVFVRVDPHARVTLDTNFYSVPTQYVGQMLLLRASEQVVHLFHQASCVATHPRNWGRNQRVYDPKHRLSIPTPSPGAKNIKGRERLRQVAPQLVDRFMNILLDEGQNMGLCTARLIKLLDLYGGGFFCTALQAVLNGERPSLSAMTLACETARRQAQPNTLVVPQFSNHVDDHDVIAHNLENYDDRPF